MPRLKAYATTAGLNQTTTEDFQRGIPAPAGGFSVKLLSSQGRGAWEGCSLLSGALLLPMSPRAAALLRAAPVLCQGSLLIHVLDEACETLEL